MILKLQKGKIMTLIKKIKKKIICFQNIVTTFQREVEKWRKSCSRWAEVIQFQEQHNFMAAENSVQL